jgi:hypothetical protein
MTTALELFLFVWACFFSLVMLCVLSVVILVFVVNRILNLGIKRLSGKPHRPWDFRDWSVLR